MLFDTLTGNDRTVAAMRNMVATGRVPHAILLYENDGGGAFPLSLAFLEALYGGSGKVAKLIHPDIHFVFPVTGGSKVSTSEKPTSDNYMQWFRELALEHPCFTESELYQALGIEGKSGLIAVGEARLILDKLSLTGVEGGWRSVVMYLPEKMNQEAANRLLKIVEEPPQQTLFLMITHAPEKVLKTISSRCLSIRVLPPKDFSTSLEMTGDMSSRPSDASLSSRPSEASGEISSLFGELMDALLEKNLLTALEVGESLAALSSREKQKDFCRYAGECLREVFLLQQGMEQLTRIPEEETDYYRRLAGTLKRSFPRLAAAQLDRAVTLIERNVNQKIIFTDLVDRLYRNL